MVTKRVNKLINAPSFRQFMRQNQAVTLFRSMLVKTKTIQNEDLRENISKEIKSQFRQNQHITDPAVIKMLLIEGNRSLKQIEALGSENWGSNSTVPTSTETNMSDDDKERYRVGTDWPWDRNNNN
jgi:hypothetical protein